MGRGMHLWSTTLTPLPTVEFDRRHRGLLVLLAAHLVLLPAFGLLEGWSLATGVALDVPIALFGGLALLPPLSRMLRASATVMGLLCCSAVLVWLWHGTIEAHFHYFVIVGAVALYEAWLPYLIAFVFVIVQHGAMSAWFGHHVFNHMNGMEHAWGWAAIHGAFIAALAIANLVSWRANDDLRRSELQSSRRFEHAFTGAPNGTALIAQDGTLLEVNPALAGAARTAPEALRGSQWTDLVAAGQRPQWPPAAGGFAGELPLCRPDGTEGWLLWKLSPLNDDEGRWIAQTTDMSERRDAERRLAYQATHDALTDLPNRAAFHDVAQTALDEREPGEEVAVMFADVDNFKVINDSLGHAAGDELLVGVTGRVRGVLRQDDVVGRFGGDEFVICLRHTDATAGFAAAERVAASLAVPFMLGEVERTVTASIGLVVTGDPDCTVNDLLRDADIAMYEAKAEGKNRCRLFGSQMRDEALDRLQLEADLREAVARGDIYAHFQAQVDLATGRVIGFEALARWQHPTRGNVPPGVFIPIAEHSGLVGQISAGVLREACEHATAWGAAHPALARLRVSANASPRCLCNAELPGTVAAIVRDTGIDPRLVCLEITETAIVGRDDKTSGIVAALRAIGIRLSIDDFGVGESSLSQLATFGTLDELKIDKSFVDALAVPRSINGMLVGAVIDVALALGMSVVAEGIEAPEQAERLRAMGCPIGQGFYFSRPKPPAELLADLLGTPVPAG